MLDLEIEELTPREMEIVEAICDSLPNKGIAARLCISEKTVKNHISRIFGKMRVESRVGVAVKALRYGLFS